MYSKYASWIIFFIAIFFIAVPWFSIQSQYLVNGNISWLLMAAERLLDGQSLSQHIYEPNPPLSILIYIPHVLFSKALSLPLPTGSFYLTSIFVVISIIVTALIIKNFTFLSLYEKKAFILGYLISSTLITTLFFSEREHFMAITMIPFVLCQYALTHRIKINKILLVLVMIIGSICILIKPHYGLLPTVFLIYRMFYQKKFNIFFDIDFIVLSVSTIVYAAVLYVFFYDYIDVILPDVLTLYIAIKQPDIAMKVIETHLIINVVFFFLEAFREDLSKQKKGLVMLLYVCALLCFIPYIVQMKGYYNHIIPIYAFFTCALTLSITFRVSSYLKNYKILHFIIPVAIIALMSSQLSPLNKDYPKQSDIPSLPVGKFLAKECPKPCTFFVFHGDMEVFNPTIAAMNYTHGTRFPSLWFIPEILLGLYSNPEKYEPLRRKYDSMLAQDLEHYKPSILLIAKDLSIGNVEKFDFMKFFEADGKLKYQVDNNYKKDGEFEFDRAQYFTGTTLEDSYIMKYDIYRRN